SALKNCVGITATVILWGDGAAGAAAGAAAGRAGAAGAAGRAGAAAGAASRAGAGAAGAGCAGAGCATANRASVHSDWNASIKLSPFLTLNPQATRSLYPRHRRANPV